ncbi:MAG: hypothetical protein ACKO5C_05765 [Ferruginibacter sp.]
MSASFSSDNTNKRTIVLGIMLVLSLLLLAGLVYYYLNNNKADTANTDSPNPAATANNGIDLSVAPDSENLAESTEIETVIELEKPVVPDNRSASENTSTDAVAAADPNSTGPISFSVNGKSLTDLVAKIRSKSFQYMKNKDFTPVNPQLDETRNLFTCTLERIPSDFVRISIAHSDGTNPCDACDAVLNNNPGSSVLADKNKNGTIIKVIAVAAP